MNNPILDRPNNFAPASENLRHLGDVVGDPNLSAEAKRALLAAWASDVCAVTNAPTLRQLDNGAVATLDDILAAPKELDGRRRPA